MIGIMRKRGRPRKVELDVDASGLLPQSSPRLTTKLVVLEEEYPTADEVLVIRGLDGHEFQFVKPFFCGPTDYALVRERLPKGILGDDMIMAPIGALYFRDLTVGAPRGKLVRRERVQQSATAIQQEIPTPAITTTPSKRTRKSKGANTPKRPRGRPRKSA